MRKRREVKVNGRAILTIALIVMLVVSFIVAAVRINRETEKYCIDAYDDAVIGLANDIKVDMGDYLEQIESIANAIGTYAGASYEDYAVLLSSYCSGNFIEDLYILFSDETMLMKRTEVLQIYLMKYRLKKKLRSERIFQIKSLILMMEKLRLLKCMLP